MYKAYILILVSTLFFGCGSSAKISLLNGRQFKGEIFYSDNESIKVSTFGNYIKTISKDSIGDIDHPGNGLAVTGACITGYFILNYIVGLSMANDQEDESCYRGVCNKTKVNKTPIHAVNITGLNAGGAMLIYGFANWLNSVRHVRRSNVNMTLNNKSFGAVYSYRF